MRPSPWLLAFLLGFSLYAITLRGTYIYDDEFIVREDPRLHSISEWPKFWTQAYFPQGQDRLYRPLTSTTFAIEWALFGNRPWVFHLTNILIYAASCAGVAELARRLGGNQLGYIAGLLFAAHPVHVEAVAGLVGRAELLSTAAMVWAMILSLEPLRTKDESLLIPSPGTPGEGKGGGSFEFRISDFEFKRNPHPCPTPEHQGREKPGEHAELVPAVLSAGRIFLSTLLFVIALFSKEQAILLPAFIATLFFWRSPGCTSAAQKSKILLVCLFWLDATYIIIRENSRMKFSWDPGPLNWTVQPLILAHGLDRWLISFTVLGHYTYLLFFPIHQSIDYGYAIISYVQSRDDPFLWLGITAAISGASALLIAIIKRNWLIAWLLLCLALSYGMISNFAGIIGTIMGERLMFLPSVFFVILIAWLIFKLPKGAATILVLLGVVLGSIRTEVYALQWNDRLNLYLHQSHENPRSEHIWSLLAGEDKARGNYPMALDATTHMQQIDSDYWVGWYFAGDIAMEMGRYDLARQYLDRAWKCPIAGNLEINYLRGEIHQREKNQPPAGGLQPRKIKHNVPSTNS